MMRFVAFLVLLAGVSAAVVLPAGADVPPPYDLYGIGATMADAEPFPKIDKVDKAGPAALAGVKIGDQILALNGTYSATSAPFYFFARGLDGPRGSVAELIVLRGQAEVRVVKVKRTVRKG
ncbi:MAG: PDZ domain-containing protein [Alphaproteobacteria bacterium]|nr:PDZ domain-containing protein [Alphaproteobacteria bacterium]